MKTLFVFCCVFFFVGSVSAQYCYQLTVERGQGGLNHEFKWETVTCNDGGGDDDIGTGDDGPGSNPNLPPTNCNTNVTMVSQTTYSVGSGCSVIVEEWEHSCTPGNQGTCRTGFSYTARATGGCEEIELPPPPGPETTLTTVNCN